jgi:hypothetical protein
VFARRPGAKQLGEGLGIEEPDDICVEDGGKFPLVRAWFEVSAMVV